MNKISKVTVLSMASILIIGNLLPTTAVFAQTAEDTTTIPVTNTTSVKTPATVQPTVADDVVDIPDPLLKAALLAATKTTDGILTKTKLMTIDTLTLRGDIANLSGMEYLTKLRNLYVSDITATDYTPLEQLTKLSVVSINTRTLTSDNFPDLTHNPNLQQLDIARSSIDDTVYPKLLKLKTLVFLDISRNQAITTIAPLKDLPNLFGLIMQLTGVHDFTVIKDFPKLKKLAGFSQMIYPLATPDTITPEDLSYDATKQQILVPYSIFKERLTNFDGYQPPFKQDSSLYFSINGEWVDSSLITLTAQGVLIDGQSQTVFDNLNSIQLNANFDNLQGTYQLPDSYLDYIISNGWYSHKYLVAPAKISQPVTVKYLDDQNNEIANSETLTGAIGASYTAQEKTISGYTFKQVVGNPTGIFTDQAQTVTYMYTKDPVKAAEVTVKYQDEAGNQVADTEVLNGNVGEDYHAVQKEITGYSVVSVTGVTDGVLSENAETVTYVYRKDPVKAADITVNYQDETGNSIADSIVLSGNLDDPYQTTAKEVQGYTFSKVIGQPAGTFSANAQTVTYVYTENPIKAADVTVKYQDETGQSIAADVVLSGNIGDQYQTIQKDIAGYQFKKVDGVPTGLFTENAQTITYVYSKLPVKAADVTVQYQDETGKQIADSEILSGNVGDKYQTVQKAVAGYTFKAVQGATAGTLSEKPQTVTYVYTKNLIKAADVTVKYQDEMGQSIAADVVLSGNIGNQYQTIQKDIAGYQFKKVDGVPAGLFSATAQTITYVYSKLPTKAADVTVKYQDETGQTIAEDVVLSGNMGNQYQTIQKDIAGYQFKKVDGVPAGLFSATAQTITYVYSKLPIKAADVTVEYQDEAGHAIAAAETLSGNVGDEYHTVQKVIAGYTFKTVQGATDGTLTGNAQIIIYKYVKQTIPAVESTVTVKYVDEKGTQIAENELLKGSIGTQYTTTKKQIKNYTFKAVTGSAQGVFTKDNQTVVYEYSANETTTPDHDYTVVVEYVDENGQKLAKDQIIQGRLGDAYQTTEKKIAGYQLVKSPDNQAGHFEKDNLVVSYVYRKEEVKTSLVAPKQTATQTAKEQTRLPQTGEKVSALIPVLMGIGVFLIGASLVLLVKRNKEK